MLHQVQSGEMGDPGTKYREIGALQSKGKGKVVTCYYYDKEGHFKRDRLK